jgi:hypothetical protein
LIYHPSRIFNIVHFGHDYFWVKVCNLLSNFMLKVE